jgi:hypothetical protein
LIAAKKRKKPQNTSPSPHWGESDATFAHRISRLGIGWGEGGRRPYEVFPGSGEGLGVRVLGEVFLNHKPFEPLINADTR